MMNVSRSRRAYFGLTGSVLVGALLVSAASVASEPQRSVLVLTSTNSASGNDVVVFKLEAGKSAALSLAQTLPTGGLGGASGNAGIVQFKNDLGAVANYGSNTVSRLARYEDAIGLNGAIQLASGCVKPDSVALTEEYLFVVGATCAESHRWPSGGAEGPVVHLTDPSSAQIVVGKTWAAVTQTSGSVLQLPLAREGELSGTSATVTLPDTANNTPLGAAFWGDILGFDPAHSVDSFALVNSDLKVFPVAGPTPPYPSNAPCWLAKGPGNVWYAGNSPGQAISIFFSDGEGGVFYKSVSLPGVATDVTVSHDGKWLAVIYTAGGSGYASLFSIDRYGDLTQVATSSPIGVASFSGVAISE
jgi:hypothetical protein